LRSRIVSLVGDRTNGIWTTRIEVEYKQKFRNSNLPEDWVKQLGKESRIEVDEPIPGRYILKPILKPASAAASSESPTPTPASASPSRRPSPTSQLKPLPGAATNGLLQKQQNSELQPRPPAITYPEDEYWEVYITNVYSTVSVFLRFLEDKYQGRDSPILKNNS
jgi:hypothetical protein